MLVCFIYAIILPPTFIKAKGDITMILQYCNIWPVGQVFLAEMRDIFT